MLPVLLGVGACVLYEYGSAVPCLLYRLTGIYCPGCGSGRAARCLLHLDIAQAADQNLLFVILLPFLAYYLIKQYIFYVTGRDVLPFFEIGYRGSVALLIVIVLFQILRNIPVFPLSYLAPN